MFLKLVPFDVSTQTKNPRNPAVGVFHTPLRGSFNLQKRALLSGAKGHKNGCPHWPRARRVTNPMNQRPGPAKEPNASRRDRSTRPSETGRRIRIHSWRRAISREEAQWPSVGGKHRRNQESHGGKGGLPRPIQGPWM